MTCSRKTARIWFVLAVVIGGSFGVTVTVVAAVIVGLVASSILAPRIDTPQAAPPAITGSATPNGGDRTAAYTFGHTAGSIAAGTAGVGTDITQRIPFELDSAVDSVQLHVRNWSYIDDKPLPGRVDLTAIAIGKSASGQIPGDSSAFASTPAVISNAVTITDGEEYVSPWFSAAQIGYEPNVPFFLSLGLKTDASTKLGVAGNAGWMLPSADPAAATTQKSIGTYNMGGTFLDMWLTYRFTGDEEVVVVAGHSLNSGANGNVAEHPHTGENSAWHQIWANENKTIASSISVPGSWTPQFAADSPKWEIDKDVSANTFVLWSASNDIAGGESLTVLKAAWLATIAKAREVWPGVKVYVMTEPPRGLSGQTEQNRNAWNAYLRSDPSVVDGVIDVDKLVADPSNPTILNPDINGDNAHMSPKGNAEVAALFQANHSKG